MSDSKRSNYSAELTKGSLLAQNSLLNLLSKVLPMIAAVACIPIIIEQMGTERFGVLTISWMFIGYFSLFDLGLGRALINLVAGRLGNNEPDELRSIIWSALLFMLGIGFFGMIVLLLSSNLLVYQIFEIPSDLQSEALKGMYVLAVATPFSILATGFRGILEAYQRFKGITIVQLIVGTLNYAGTVVVLFFTTHLAYVVGFLMFLKVFSCLSFGWLGFRTAGLTKLDFKIRRENIKDLFSFGSWVTVSNIINPLIGQLDRLLIGSFVTMTAVSYYTTPFDLIRKLNIIPTAFVGVLFPAFSTSFRNDKKKADRLFRDGVTITEFIILPVSVFLILFAEEILRLWLNPEFADNSSLVLKILATTIIFNNLAQLPFAYLQGISRPDITAKIHMAELPFLAILLWPMIVHFGIVGAAITSGVRIIIDFALLMFYVHRFAGAKIFIYRWVVLPLIIALGAFAVEIIIVSVLFKLLLFLFFTTFLLIVVWKRIVTPEQRDFLVNNVQKILKK